MKIRWWPFDASPQMASTRIRCLNVMAGLRRRGVDASLLELSEQAPSILVLSKRYDPDTLAACAAMRAAGTRIVLDLCDNHFHVDTPSDAAHRRTGWLREAIAFVDALTVSTPALALALHQACEIQVPVHVIGDAFEEPLEPGPVWSVARVRDELDLARLRWQLIRGRRHASTRLLWFGNHGTAHAAGGMLDLLMVMPSLNEVAAGRSISLTVISNSRRKYETVRGSARFPVLYLDWSPFTFSRAAVLHQVALLPVQDNPFTRCKTNNRLATALLHGLAVIADPIPSYREFESCVHLGDWPLALRRVCDEPERRHAMTAAGVEHLRRVWNIDQVSQAWHEALQAVESQPARSVASG